MRLSNPLQLAIYRHRQAGRIGLFSHASIANRSAARPIFFFFFLPHSTGTSIPLLPPLRFLFRYAPFPFNLHFNLILGVRVRARAPA